MSNRPETLSLTPAEAFVILYPKTNDGKRLLKLTLLDLMFKKVLRSELEQPQGRIFKKKKKVLVWRGENFGRLPLKWHETPFDYPFQMGYPVELKDLARHVVKQISSVVQYSAKYVCPALVQSGYMEVERKRFLFIPYDSFRLSSYGLQMQAYLQNLLKEGKDQLETWVRYHPARATAYLAAAGSVIFLLDNFNSEVMKQWKQQLAVDSAGDDGFDYAFTSFDFDFVSSDSFSDFDSSFDSSFDGGSGSSDWGGDGGGDGGGGDGGGGGE